MNRQRPFRPTSPDILQRLEQCGVRFRDLQEAPAAVTALATSFVDFPPQPPFSDRTSSLETLSKGIRTLSYDTGAEMMHAIQAAATPQQRVIQDAAGSTKAYWMRKIDFPILMKAFDRSFESGDITVMEGTLWSKGWQLQDGRLTAHPGYANPRPDAVAGLDFVRGDAVESGDPLCATGLHKLREAFPGFEPSPDGYVLFPGFIFEGNSEAGSAEVLKARIALGAARALALLQRIKHLSGIPSQAPTIPLATCAGHKWTFYLATVSEAQGEGMDTTLFQIGPTLDIANVCDMVRLRLVLYRINHWLISTYTQRVREDLIGMKLLLPRPQRAAAGRARQVPAGVEGQRREVEEEGVEGRAEPEARPARLGEGARERRP